MRAVESNGRAAHAALWIAALVGAASGAGGAFPIAAAQDTGPHALAASTAQATEATEDIRDIRGPKAMPGSWVVPALLAGAIAVALVYAVWRRHQRTIRPRELPLSEQALERLERTRPLMFPATAREFGIAASEVIRSYIEKRFDVIATQRTTEEFLQLLIQSSNDSLARHRSLLAEFLQQCDFVKFAGASLAQKDMESLFQSARTFVLETGQPSTT
jgi:Domain of unknown function (DUF4381)